MRTLSVSAQDVDSNSIDRFSWKWSLKDIVQDKDVKVFSCFSCGGGSTMGYKRAGFQVLGNVEIDPRMNKIYLKNQHPKYNFNMDLRDFNKLDELPDELYHLDILDGSPPCSTFSTAGDREKAWGKQKVFREGQKKQTLDDLFFVFLDVVEKLKPKIVIAENVTGILKGNAKGYVNEIINSFHNFYLAKSGARKASNFKTKTAFTKNCLNTEIKAILASLIYQNELGEKKADIIAA